MPRYGTIDRDYGRRLATCDPASDGPIYMLNLMKYRERADYGAAGDGGISGRDADDRYAPVEVLGAIGAIVCFTADVVEASEDWDRVGVVKYPSRRAFIEMQARPDFQDKHVHKDAGMDHTIVMGTLPAGDLPARTKPGRVLLEVWADAPPAEAGAGGRFDVEGTIVGDGRSWTAVRYAPLDGAADLSSAGEGHQVLVLAPIIDRWA